MKILIIDDFNTLEFRKFRRRGGGGNGADSLIKALIQVPEVITLPFVGLRLFSFFPPYQSIFLIPPGHYSFILYTTVQCAVQSSYTYLSVWFLFVCLSLINVKTAEPIGTKFFMRPYMISGKVYGWLELKKCPLKIILYFHENKSITEQQLKVK